jgi:beta-lactamase regulating signal transducer with metallopeptidase domain
VTLRLWLALWAPSGGGAIALGLLLGYGVHAALWCGIAALLLSVLRRRSASTEHLCWRLALFGPLVSAPVAELLARGAHAPARELGVSLLGPPLSAGAAPAALAAVDAGGVLGTAAVIALALGALRVLRSLLLLCRGLRGRVPVRDARLVERFERVRARARVGAVTLTESGGVGSPLALGLAEICVPSGALASLSDAELDGVFAHELAHLERRDGLWFPAAAVVQSLLWMQPLNHLVSARYRRSAELACDDRAVALTRDPRALARALVSVAERAARVHPLLLPAMVRPAAVLTRRVQRLLAPEAAPPVRAGRRAALVALGAFGVASGAVSVGVDAALPRATVPMPPAPDDTEVVSGPPDALSTSARLLELAQHEPEVEAALAAAEAVASHELEGAPAAVRVLELRQELEHLRAERAFIEERYVEAWAAWERRAGSEPGSSEPGHGRREQP